MPNPEAKSKPFVVETAGAALFIANIARDAGDSRLAHRADAAALHLRGVTGLSDGRREDVSRIIDGDEKVAVTGLLKAMAARGNAAAETVLVELTDPQQFWREIREAKELSRLAGMPDIPDSPAGLVDGEYATGPMSRVDLPRLSLPGD